MSAAPVFSADEQVKAIGALLEAADIPRDRREFIRLVAAKRRLFVIREMIADYGKLYDRFRGVNARAGDQRGAALGRKRRCAQGIAGAISGGNEVDLNVKIDASIIGGLIVQLGSRMVDGSLKTKLNAIRTRMKEVG